MTTTAPRLPGYEYVRPLGRGGFSDVHLYQQLLPHREVAVKVLRIDTLDDRQRRAFTSEANTMAQLAEHPNIVSVISADLTADGRPYLVMSYYPGEDLGRRVAERPFGVAEVLRTGIQLACAIESAHRLNVVHRDIKPANILVSRSGAPGLSDFGIAGNSHALHEDDEIGVSIPWSAPEVLAGDSNGSVATDIYSLGATLWHLLVGRPPFRVPHGDNSQRATIERILRSPAPGTGVADVPQTLDRLLAQCLAKNPAHRPRSAIQLARELQQIEVAANLSRTELVVLDQELPHQRGGPYAAPPGAPVADPTVGKAPVSISPMPDLAPRGAEPTLSRSSPLRHDAEAPVTLHKAASRVGDPSSGAERAAGPRPWAAIAAVVGTLAAASIGVALLARGDDQGQQPERTTGTQTQQPPAALTDPPPAAPVPGEPRPRGARVEISWPAVAGAAAYGYRNVLADLGGTRPVPAGATAFRVPRPDGRRQDCYVVTAYNSDGLPSPDSSQVCVGGSR